MQLRSSYFPILFFESQAYIGLGCFPLIRTFAQNNYWTQKLVTERGLYKTKQFQKSHI